MKKLLLCTLVVLASLCLSAQTTTLSKPYSRSLNAATTTGDGLVFVAPLEGGTTPAQWTMTTAVTGFSAIQIQLLGSINNSNWFVLATSSSTTGESIPAAQVATYVKCTIVSKAGTGTATCDIASSSASAAYPGVPSCGVGCIAPDNLKVGATLQTVRCSGDITTTLQAAINSQIADGGGTVQLSSGSCYSTAQITIPNDGATPPKQKALRLLGSGSYPGTTEGTAGTPLGGTILDLRYSGTGAKIVSYGEGYLEIAYITFTNTLGDATDFVNITNTASRIHDNSFIGQAAKTGALGTTDQDAIVLGGTALPVDGSADAPFQGYGTVIERNYFNRLRRGVYVRLYGNGVIIRDNMWWLQNGADATAGLIELDNGVQGVVIENNIMETAYVAYPIKLTNATQSTITGNGFYDRTATTLAYVRFEAASGGNLLIHGLALVAGETVATSDDNGSNAVCGASGNTFTCGGPKDGSIGLKANVTTGIGFYAQATTGFGFQGLNSSASNPAVLGQNSSTGYGVQGKSTVNGIGVYGEATGGFAVYGSNNGAGAGVRGVSATGRGVEGILNSGSEAVAGVNSGAGTGVYGSATSGQAVIATTTTGIALYANTASGTVIADFRAASVQKAVIDNTGKGTFQGGVVPAATGGAITWFQKATHATLDLASVATGACTAETTETITGAAVADSCSVSASTALEAGGLMRCAVTAADTAKWQLCNLSGGAIDRASDTYTIRVLR